jgi:valyl-tRNA synthetase
MWPWRFILRMSATCTCTAKMLRLPLTNREIPVILDEWVSREFGTGAVKVTPAHDPNDFALGQRHNLPSINVMDETAHITSEGGPMPAWTASRCAQEDR